MLVLVDDVDGFQQGKPTRGMSVRTQLMGIEAYMALAGLRALRNVQIHASRGLIRFVGAGNTRQVKITVKGEAHLISRGRVVRETANKNIPLRVPQKLIRVKGTEGLPVVRSWAEAAAWLGISEVDLRGRRVGFVLMDEKTFPLVSSVEQLKRDLAA
jgi:hypothetical protein